MTGREVLVEHSDDGQGSTSVEGMTGADGEREELADLVRELGVVHGRVTLASGREADYYVDLRRVTLHHRAAPLVGRLLRVLTADWDYAAVGGLTLGADPVADAVLHAVAAERAADPATPPWMPSSCASRPRSTGCSG